MYQLLLLPHSRIEKQVFVDIQPEVFENYLETNVRIQVPGTKKMIFRWCPLYHKPHIIQGLSHDMFSIVNTIQKGKRKMTLLSASKHNL